eukprot:COSAG02_NODE_211_length_28730_cov_5.599490_25_plen_83_part_00
MSIYIEYTMPNGICRLCPSLGRWRCATRTIVGGRGLLLLLALLLLRALLLLLEAWAADVRLLSRRWGWCVVQCGGHLLSGER